MNKPRLTKIVMRTKSGYIKYYACTQVNYTTGVGSTKRQAYVSFKQNNKDLVS